MAPVHYLLSMLTKSEGFQPGFLFKAMLHLAASSCPTKFSRSKFTIFEN
jgi:hypothetical protein